MNINKVLGKEAELYYKLPNGRIKCTACARLCEIPEGKIGLCGIRGVVDNKLQLLVYGKVIAGNIDPIEKKPVTHYKPGTDIFSIGTTGCNWLCKYCKNYDISQRRKIEGVNMTPKEVVDAAVSYGSQGIAYRPGGRLRLGIYYPPILYKSTMTPPVTIIRLHYPKCRSMFP